jgi:cell division septation protein DedD
MDMKAAPKTRIQRRVEKRQMMLLVALVVVISICSFSLGVMVGRQSVKPETLAVENEPARISVPIVPPPVVDQEEHRAKAPEETLSFYENLSKSESAPIGSGINLPPQKEPAGAEAVKAEAPGHGITLPPKAPQTLDELISEVKRPAEPVVAQAPSSALAADKNPPQVPTRALRLPPAVRGGSWVVQVFSSQSAADAGILRDNLNAKGYPAYIAEADLGQKGLWYRVNFGPFAEKSNAIEAQLFAAEKDKLKGFVRQR